MAKYLVIVESPAKVKTIKKFLGSNYEVMASNGHVRDLPKSKLGIDVEHDYEPQYITIRGKGDILAALRKEVKKADKVYLATDPDREGEAISWHLYMALKLEDKKVYRITFNEITKNAVKESLKHPREIDMNLVDAQQTRRMLDRMVGYRISPVLWAKVKRGLSAGRVQSVALRLIADREDEINAFIPEEYWNLEADFKIQGEKKPLRAKFYGKKDEKINIKSREQLDGILKELEHAEFQVTDVKNGVSLSKTMNKTNGWDSKLRGQESSPFRLRLPRFSRKPPRRLTFPHRRPCALHSSCMKKDLSVTCVRIPPVFPMKRQRRPQSLSRAITERNIYCRGMKKREQRERFRMPTRQSAPLTSTGCLQGRKKSFPGTYSGFTS